MVVARSPPLTLFVPCAEHSSQAAGSNKQSKVFFPFQTIPNSKTVILILNWAKLWSTRAKKPGMRSDTGPRIKEWLEEAGFMQVNAHRMPWTIGGWSRINTSAKFFSASWIKVRLDTGVKDLLTTKCSSADAKRSPSQPYAAFRP